MLATIRSELKAHAPFTVFGTLTGVVIMVAVTRFPLPEGGASALFWTFHPLHVFLSALVTAGMYRRHGSGTFWGTLAIGYFGSIGIATLSDSIIPYVGEVLLSLPHRSLHLGVIEKWWLVNPLALAGIALVHFRSKTKFPHAGHVLLSTWASLFHIRMALGTDVGAGTMILLSVFLFLAVWLPCCTSDIVFPLLFAKRAKEAGSR